MVIIIEQMISTLSYAHQFYFDKVKMDIISTLK